MAYKDPQEAFADPDFRQSKPETQRWALKTMDPKGWGTKNDQEIDAFLTRMKPNWERENKQNQVTTQQMAQLPPQGPPPEEVKKAEKKTMWQSAVAPVTELVGRGMEELTKPLVPLSRMLKGESNPLEGYAAGDFQGAGGKAASTRQTAAAGVVPQSPWQAGAMGAQFIPGVGAAGAVPRIAASAVGAGGLQALFGEKGVVEGGNLQDVAQEGAQGVLKGAATQTAGEGLRKLVSAGNRVAPGATRRAGEADTREVMGAVRQISPELQPGKGMQGAGAYFTGSKGAKMDASAAFKQRLQTLEGELNAQQGHPFINTPELVQAYRQILKSVGKDPVLGPQMSALAPSPQGFLPEQAAKIVSLTGQRLGANQTGLGHMKDEAMDQLVASIERSLPPTAQGMLSGARGDYAKASGLQELLAPAFKPGKGYQIDMRELQKTLSTDPDFLNRLGKSQLEALFQAVTRGASKGPGFADIPAGNFNVPYPSTQGAMVAALRNLVNRGKLVGKHPLSMGPGFGSGAGVATTAATSVANRARQRED